jgi:hypothetical protein
MGQDPNSSDKTSEQENGNGGSSDGEEVPYMRTGNQVNIKAITKRTIAYIILKVSGTLGGGFVMGIEIWQAAAMAAFIGFMEVTEELSRAYVEDGDISDDDMNTIFGKKAQEHDDSDPELQ